MSIAAPAHKATLSWHGPPAPLPWPTIGTFVDTVALRLPRETGEDLERVPRQRALRRLCGSLHVERSGPRNRPSRHTRVLMHQPIREALHLADTLIDEHNGLIQEVYFTLEVAADSATDAERKAEYLSQRLRRPWARTPWCFRIGDDLGTHATSSKRWDVDRYKIYPGRSKLDPGRWCARIERQLSGTKKAMKGIGGLVHASDVPGLLEGGTWDRWLAFEEVDVLMLGRQYRGRGRAKRPDSEPLTQSGTACYDRDVSAGGMISRLSALKANEPWIEGSAQAVRSYCRKEPWFNARTALRPLPVTAIVITPSTSTFPPRR